MSPGSQTTIFRFPSPLEKVPKADEDERGYAPDKILKPVPGVCSFLHRMSPYPALRPPDRFSRAGNGDATQTCRFIRAASSNLRKGDTR